MPRLDSRHYQQWDRKEKKSSRYPCAHHIRVWWGPLRVASRDILESTTDGAGWRGKRGTLRQYPPPPHHPLPCLTSQPPPQATPSTPKRSNCVNSACLVWVWTWHFHASSATSTAGGKWKWRRCKGYILLNLRRQLADRKVCYRLQQTGVGLRIPSTQTKHTHTKRQRKSIRNIFLFTENCDRIISNRMLLTN